MQVNNTKTIDIDDCAQSYYYSLLSKNKQTMKTVSCCKKIF